MNPESLFQWLLNFPMVFYTNRKCVCRSFIHPSWHLCHSFMRHSLVPRFVTSLPPSRAEPVCSSASLSVLCCSSREASVILDRSHSYRHTHTHQPGALSTTGTTSPSIQTSVRPYVPLQPPLSPNTGTPSPTQEQGRCWHHRANTSAASRPPSKPRHSSRARPKSL